MLTGIAFHHTTWPFNIKLQPIFQPQIGNYALAKISCGVQIKLMIELDDVGRACVCLHFTNKYMLYRDIDQEQTGLLYRLCANKSS